MSRAWQSLVGLAQRHRRDKVRIDVVRRLNELPKGRALDATRYLPLRLLARGAPP